jgi:hypothetical protein
LVGVAILVIHIVAGLIETVLLVAAVIAIVAAVIWAAAELL